MSRPLIRDVSDVWYKQCLYVHDHNDHKENVLQVWLVASSKALLLNVLNVLLMYLCLAAVPGNYLCQYPIFF